MITQIVSFFKVSSDASSLCLCQMNSRHMCNLQSTTFSCEKISWGDSIATDLADCEQTILHCTKDIWNQLFWSNCMLSIVKISKVQINNIMNEGNHEIVASVHAHGNYTWIASFHRISCKSPESDTFSRAICRRQHSASVLVVALLLFWSGCFRLQSFHASSYLL